MHFPLSVFLAHNYLFIPILFTALIEVVGWEFCFFMYCLINNCALVNLKQLVSPEFGRSSVMVGYSSPWAGVGQTAESGVYLLL